MKNHRTKFRIYISQSKNYSGVVLYKGKKLLKTLSLRKREYFDLMKYLHNYIIGNCYKNEKPIVVYFIEKVTGGKIKELLNKLKLEVFSSYEKTSIISNPIVEKDKFQLFVANNIAMIREEGKIDIYNT